MKRLLDFLSIALSAIAALSVIWIVVPAPAYYIWLFSLTASEWSLWFGIIALFGVVCALLSRAVYGNGTVWLISLFMGNFAFLVSLYPLLTSLSAAREQHVELSFAHYFRGASKETDSTRAEAKNFTTYNFAHTGEIDLKLDAYLPPDNIKNNAAVIVIHGGSWNGGVRSDFPQLNWWLTQQGFTVFDIDYRLAPQPNYLAATADVKCAVRWVKEHAAEFQIAPESIVLYGRSAGAHLALLAAYSAGDEHLPASCGEKDTSETVRAVVSLYAPTDLLWSYENPANQFVIDGPATLSRFLGGSPHESAEIRDRFILASPALHIASNTPPTLLIHGGQDQLVRSENMSHLAEELKAGNVLHKTLFIPYAQHGFDYNFNGWGAQITKSVILDFLRENTQTK